jgi:hypothetical protein
LVFLLQQNQRLESQSVAAADSNRFWKEVGALETGDFFFAGTARILVTRTDRPGRPCSVYLNARRATIPPADDLM